MGLPMALNLHKKLQSHGSNLIFSNRTLSKGAALVEAGAVARNNIVEVAQQCDDIFTMVSLNAHYFWQLYGRNFNLTFEPGICGCCPPVSD